MQIQDTELAGIDILKIRDAFLAFLKLPMDFDQSRDPMVRPKKLDVQTLMTLIPLEERRAMDLQRELIDRNYIKEDKLTPTEKGMALAYHVERDRISYQKAKELLEELLLKAQYLNDKVSASGGRVYIESIAVFGSYQEGREDLGDIDLLIQLTHHPMAEPEDRLEEDKLLDALSFNEYFSFHDKLGTFTLDISPSILFERKNGSACHQ